jgi:hypothetical protein
MAFGPISAFWSTALARVRARLAALASIIALREPVPFFPSTVQIAQCLLEQQRASSLRLILTQRGKARRLWFAGER